MNKKTLVVILGASALAIGTWAWAQQSGQGQPTPQGGMGHGESGMHGAPGQPGPGMGPGGMMMGGQGQQGGMGMGHGMMGQQGGMGPGGMMMGGSRSERPIISEILAAKDRVGLTAEQEGKLKSLRVDFEKEAIRRGAEIQAAEVDLRELLAAEASDLGKVEAQVKKIAALQGELRFARIKVLQEGRAVLTKEQWQKFETVARQQRPMGPGGQPGPGMGPGGMMMMGPGQSGMQGMHEMMMGGMMQNQPGSGMGPGMMMGGMGQGGQHGQQAPQSGAGMMVGAQQAPARGGDGATRTDATGPVTVNATLLQAGSDRVVFEVKLDTHSVDLDAYKLEAGVVLRNDRGESAAPTVESPAGSGHHRGAMLAFPGSLAGSGAKRVELVVRDLGGVKERILRWDAPFVTR